MVFRMIEVGCFIPSCVDRSTLWAHQPSRTQCTPPWCRIYWIPNWQLPGETTGALLATNKRTVLETNRTMVPYRTQFRRTKFSAQTRNIGCFVFQNPFYVLTWVWYYFDMLLWYRVYFELQNEASASVCLPVFFRAKKNLTSRVSMTARCSVVGPITCTQHVLGNFDITVVRIQLVTLFVRYDW